jgi:HPt (histidine-containing phosphotransfer) domain-containing protein
VTDFPFASVTLDPSPNDVLDERVFAALRQLQRADRPDIVRRTIGLYLDSAPHLLEELREGAISRDVAALGRASHTLKSNSANVGAIRLAARCNELETLARSGMVAEACALVHGVIEDFSTANAELSEQLKKAA